VLVDDSGAARLELRSLRDIDRHRYSAPETTRSKNALMPSLTLTKEDDVYGMGMIAYEASSHNPGSTVKPHLDLLGLGGGDSVLLVR